MNIGLVFHTPFPSSEVFRMFPDREKFLNAILNCDLIGFHLFEHCRNFTTSCTRLLGVTTECVEGGFLGLNYCGRYIGLKVHHIGIEPKLIHTTMKSKKFLSEKLRFSERYKNKKVIFGIDKSHKLTGVNLKLNVIRKHLELHPHLRRKVKLIQMVEASRHCSQETTDQQIEELQALALVINEECGEEVVLIVHQEEVSLATRYAYFAIAHALFVTSIRDGLCLEPFEYITVL
jgi:trehalose-6-phosphate synthase